MEFTHVLPAIAGLVILAGLVVLWIAAVVSILRSSLASPVVKGLWILAVLAFTFVGPVVWFIVSAHERRHPRASLTTPVS